LDDLNITKENEIYLRSKLMQIYNDVNRDQEVQHPAIAAQIENWNRLLEILDSNDSQEKLLKVVFFLKHVQFMREKRHIFFYFFANSTGFSSKLKSRAE
jgi:hypothetical protein